MRQKQSNELSQSAKVMGADLLVKGALMGLRMGQVGVCADNIKVAMKMLPASRDFLPIAFALIDTERIGVAEAIAELYIQHYPQEAIGYGCLAQIYSRGYANSGGLHAELLDLADKTADIALSLESNPHALLVKANGLRLRNAPLEQSARIFSTLTSQYKDFMPGYYNYGLLWLPTAPRKALELFEKAANLSPGDTDCWTAQVRALIQMDRIAEAAKRLLVAEKLNPDDAAVVHLRAQLDAMPDGRARGS